MPFNKIRRLVGVFSLASSSISLINVVFPEPVGPTNLRHSPFLIQYVELVPAFHYGRIRLK